MGRQYSRDSSPINSDQTPASCEIMVTTYQITWYTMISRCSYELPDYNVTTLTTTINIHHSENTKSHKEWKGSLHFGIHPIFQTHYL